MSNLEITGLEPYSKNQNIDIRQAGVVVKTGFGGRTLDECIEDAENHLATARLVQFAKDDDQLVGFGMYEIQDNDLYLNGIVIRRANQARQLGSTMVRQAFQQTGARRLYAVTRNPAILRIMQEVCDYVQPSPGINHGDIVSHKTVEVLAGRIGLPTGELPYHRGRYPENLYNQQPQHNNSEFQRMFEECYDLSNIQDAVMLVGVRDEN